MNIFRAIILGETRQAEAFEYMPVFGLFFSKRYRFLVSCESIDPLQEDNTFTLRIYRVTYPDIQQERGWGKPVYAEEPHTTVQIQGREKFLAYLNDYGFDTETWQPVELMDKNTRSISP